MLSNSSIHTSVLLEEILSTIPMKDNAEAREPRFVLDGTLGGAGHALQMLARYPEIKLVACDRDRVAIERARETLSEHESRVLLLHANFSDIEDLLESQEVLDFFKCSESKSDQKIAFDRIILDLGISSDQLDAPDRGFSFKGDHPLDMRMDASVGRTAADIVNEYSKSDLIRMFKRGGVGPQAVFLSNQILKKRPIDSSARLTAICEQVYLESSRRGSGSSSRKGKSHSATVPFQAIRIEVNGEFDALDKFLTSVPNILAPGGVLAVIAFHSLEDKLVTKKMREWSRLSQEQYRLPFPTETEFGTLLTKKAIEPSAEECELNPRSKSAKMRIFLRSNE